MNPMAAPVMGAPNMAPSIQMSNPAMTSEDVQRLHSKWQQMKQAGADYNNPEFLRISNQLKMIAAKQSQLQLQQQTHRMQAMQQQAQNQQAQQHQRNQSIGNGAMAQANGRLPSTSQQLQSASPSRPSGDMQMNARSGSTSFTPEQLNILHNQIVAFKHITKNMVPPAQVLQTISPHAAGKTAAAIAAIANASATIEAMKNEVEGNKPTQSGFESFSSPWKHLQPIIPFLEHGLREKRVIVPSILPTGIDLDKIAEERERVIHSRIMQRKTELEEMTSNLATHDLDADPNNLDHRLKIKALIELKSLNLLQRQRSLRLEYLKDASHGENLAFNANRSAFRRMKKQSIREARITERLEKQQREAKSEREKEKHKEHINIILQRGAQLKEECQERRNRNTRMTQKILAIHQHIEKEEQKRIERTAKQRLQALKANDEEAYMKLLDEAKDTRITHLLRQTDSFLDSLAASVREQQKNAVQTYGAVEEEGQDADQSEDEEGKPKIDYYSVAHRIKETITEQPNILVGGKLKDYQIKGLQWMVSLYNNNLNGILADEMGLGKTIQTISLITYLIEKKKQMGPYLVIVPLSTLTNWNSEFDKWAPSVTKVVYKGTPAQRKLHQQQIKYGQFQVLLTTYEFIIKDRPLLSKLKWSYMIIDEGHRMKNTQSKLSFTLTTYYNCRYRLILTGTPLQNNLPELWALLNFALPAIFKSVKSFDEWFNTPFANAGTQDKMELTEEESLLIIRRLHKVLRPFLLRRLKKDVESELPDKKEEVIKCKFSSLQAKLYQQMVSGGMLYVQDNEKGGKVNIKGLSNMIMQLRKICNHPFVFEEIENAINPSKVNNDTLWRTAGKFELLDRLLPKFFVTKHRVLMFFQMTQIMNIMEDFLHLRGYKYLRLDGSTKADDRSALLKLFNAPDSEYFVFLLSTRAGGLGLNLQTADTVIIYDSDWNPHQDLQAQDRAHRIGQKNEVRILRLITSNSVEEKILERAQYKLDIDGKVIQAGKFDNKSTNEERDALLRTLLEAEKDLTSENEEMDDDELNEVCARTDAELELFRKMDEERNKDKMYGTNGKLPRLYSDQELPDLYLNEQPVVEEIKLPEGRGARERAAIRYDDGLSEEQWLDAIDNDEDVEELIARKREKEERRAEKKARKNVRDSTPPQLPESSPVPETPVVSRKKRGRKAASEKRAAKELPPDEPKRKKARGKGVDTLAPGDRAIHQRVFDAVYDAVKNLEDKESEIQGRVHSEHFIVLPSKKLYPDYYQFIAQPISFEIIKKRIDKQQYGSIAEFKADFLLMFANAKQYNEPGSLVYADAEAMEDEFNEKLREETEKVGLSADAPAPNGDTNSAAMSTVSTPMAGTPIIKLKLGKKSVLGNGSGSGPGTGTATSLGSRSNSTPDLDNDRSEGELSE